MMPILVKLGPITIYSFGLLVGLGVLCASFIVWKKSRAAALSDEKMIDLFILSVMALLAFGRAIFVATNWKTFQADFGRVFLLFKYPGLSFLGGVIAALVTAAILGAVNGIASWLVLDIFATALAGASVFGLLGCYLDGCSQGNANVPLVLALVMIGVTAMLFFLAKRIKNTIALSGLARRPGFIFLCYLIFSSSSFLIASYINEKRIDWFYFGALILSVLTIGIRYYNTLWSNFLARFFRKSKSISRKDE